MCSGRSQSSNSQTCDAIGDRLCLEYLLVGWNYIFWIFGFSSHAWPLYTIGSEDPSSRPRIGTAAACKGKPLRKNRCFREWVRTCRTPRDIVYVECKKINNNTHFLLAVVSGAFMLVGFSTPVHCQTTKNAHRSSHRESFGTPLPPHPWKNLWIHAFVLSHFVFQAAFSFSLHVLVDGEAPRQKREVP